MAQTLWLIRHGETEWSLSGAHTGRSDLPLTPRGRQMAARMGGYLEGRRFSQVLVSPLRRAQDTCRLAGYGPQAETEPNLAEWDYGAYEGFTSEQIRLQRPGWDIWRDGVAGGETIEEVAARAQEVIERAMAAPDDVALFAHGHLLRILTACWLGLPPEAGRLFALDTATVSVLGLEHATRAIRLWNRGFTE
jgi:probable phosphoglycerate mutase